MRNDYSLREIWSLLFQSRKIRQRTSKTIKSLETDFFKEKINGLYVEVAMMSRILASHSTQMKYLETNFHKISQEYQEFKKWQPKGKYGEVDPRDIFLYQSMNQIALEAYEALIRPYEKGKERMLAYREKASKTFHQIQIQKREKLEIDEGLVTEYIEQELEKIKPDFYPSAIKPECDGYTYNLFFGGSKRKNAITRKMGYLLLKTDFSSKFHEPFKQPLKKIIKRLRKEIKSDVKNRRFLIAKSKTIYLCAVFQHVSLENMRRELFKEKYLRMMDVLEKSHMSLNSR